MSCVHENAKVAIAGFQLQFGLQVSLQIRDGPATVSDSRVAYEHAVFHLDLSG